MVTRYHRSPKPFFLYFAPIAPHVGAPREKGDPTGRSGRAPARRSASRPPARPKRVRGMLRQPDPARLRPACRRQRQPAATSADCPGRCGGCRPSPTTRKPRCCRLTRQRAEALFVLDQQIGKLIDDAQGDRRVRQHRLDVHLGQRLLPRRAPDAAGQDLGPRTVDAGAVLGRRARHPAGPSLRPDHQPGHHRDDPRPRPSAAAAPGRRPVAWCRRSRPTAAGGSRAGRRTR